MNKLFEEWVTTTLNEHVNKKGMITGSQHPLGHYTAKQAASLAWNHQQEKIDDLLEALQELKEELFRHAEGNYFRPFLDKAEDAIAKATEKTE